jgi:hypothetical protein
MKLTVYAIRAIVMLFSDVSRTNEAPARLVDVQFVNPENFADFSVRARDVRSSTSVFTQELPELSNR